MSLAEVQKGDSGTSGIASGAAATVLPGNSTISNCIAVCIVTSNQDSVFHLSSSIGNFVKITGGGEIYGGVEVEWWVCQLATGASRTITATTSGGAVYYAQATEFSGGVASVVSAGGAAGDASKLNPTLSVPGGQSGWVVLVGLGAVANGNIASAPAGWTDYNAGGFTYGGTDPAKDVAYYLSPSPNAFAQWQTFGASTYWVTEGIFLVPAAPPAPTLVSPSNTANIDVSAGVTFEATYNVYASDTMGGYALRVKLTSGAYSYWNAGTSAFQSTVVFNSDSVAPGATFSVTLPSGALSDGNSYNWSLACQDGPSGGGGPFANDFTFTAQIAPVVTVSAPAGTVTATTQPTVGWLSVLAPGANQVGYSIIVESGSYGTTPGSGTQVWASGFTPGPATSEMIGTALSNSTTYRTFVQVTESGGQTSAWGYATCTIAVTAPFTPTIVATQTTDPDTGCPIVELAVQAYDNYLDAADSDFEFSIGSAVGTNCAVADSSAEALNGAFSLQVTPTTSGNATVKLGPYPAPPVGAEVTAFAAFRSATHVRTCSVNLSWYDGASFISGTTSAGASDSTSAWTQATPTSAPPSGLIVNSVVPATATQYYEILEIQSTTGSGDVHYIDCVASKPHTSNAGSTTWSEGGFFGSTSVVITRSDNVYVRYASITNPLLVDPPGAGITNEQVTVYDYEAVPGISYTYSATVTFGAGSTAVVTSAPGVSSSVEIPGTFGWWEINPTAGTATTNPSAINAQMISWSPISTEQSQANPVLNQTTMQIAANAMMNQDFSGSAELFSDAVYTAFNALLTSQATCFVSSPWGALDSGYFRFGPQSGGMSSGSGNTAKTTSLMPSVAGTGHRTVAITAVAQPRPPV